MGYSMSWVDRSLAEGSTEREHGFEVNLLQLLAMLPDGRRSLVA
jgi:hypothetical protein